MIPKKFVAPARTWSLPLLGVLLTGCNGVVLKPSGDMAAQQAHLITVAFLLMLVIMLIVLAVGMVMDLSPTVLILVPLFMPVIKMAGIDPVYFGLMFVINCSIGLITPPVGTVLNVVCGVGGTTMSAAMRGLMPFMIAYTVLLVLFVIFPELITFPLQLMLK